MNLVNICEEIESKTKQAGILSIKNANCLKLPEYEVTPMLMVKEFSPDMWRFENIAAWGADLVVEFDDRKFVCGLSNEEVEYFKKRYGVLQEEGKNETV